MGELAAGLQEVLARLLVHRRNIVRDLPLPGRELGTQRTIPMPARPAPRVARTGGGTIKLQVVAPPVERLDDAVDAALRGGVPDAHHAPVGLDVAETYA